jgi:hypothetical protein
MESVPYHEGIRGGTTLRVWTPFAESIIKAGNLQEQVLLEFLFVSTYLLLLRILTKLSSQHNKQLIYM